MIDFWAVIGRACLDARFHRELRRRHVRGAGYSSLEELRAFLWTHDFPVSRWEVVELNYLFGKPIARPMSRIRKAFGDASLESKRDLRVCSVVGLAAIDGGFRADLYRASSTNPARTAGLRGFLSGEGIRFQLSEGELRTINRLIRDRSCRQAMDEFEALGWDRPACTVGISAMGEYFHLVPQLVRRYLIEHPDIMAELRRRGAIRL